MRCPSVASGTASQTQSRLQSDTRSCPVLMKTLAQRRQKAVYLTKRAGRLLKASTKFVQQRWAKSAQDKPSTTPTHVYEIRPRADKSGIDLISDLLPYSPLWYRGPNAIRDAIGCATHRSRSHDAVIRVPNKVDNSIRSSQIAHSSRSINPGPITPALLRLDPLWDPLRPDPSGVYLVYFGLALWASFMGLVISSLVKDL
jgi:hypothetical protein